MGQTDEVQALIDILKGSGQIMELVNGTLMSLIKKKPDRLPQYKKQVIEEAFLTISSGLEKFVDTKTSRISKLINYLQILDQQVEDEKTQLMNFESEWDPVKREISTLRIKLMNQPSFTSTEFAEKEIDHIKNNILPKALPVLEKLTELENKMQKRHIGAIALLTKMNSKVDTNELYKLLTSEP